MAPLKATGEIVLFQELIIGASNGPVDRTQNALCRYPVRLGLRRGTAGWHQPGYAHRSLQGPGRAPGEKECAAHELSDPQEHVRADELEFPRRPWRKPVTQHWPWRLKQGYLSLS